jgi:hypothetical protein
VLFGDKGGAILTDAVRASDLRGKKGMSNMRKALIVGVYLSTVAAIAHGQTTLLDTCNKIITDGLKEVDIQLTSSSFLNSSFDRFCTASGSMKSTSGGVGIAAIVNAIPVQFTGNFSSSDQAMSNFCGTYASVAAGRSQATTYEEHTVQRAYESLDSCVAFALTGVTMQETVRSLQNLDFFVAPGMRNPITLRGIETSPNIVCSGQDPNAKNAAVVKFDLSTRIVLQNSAVLNISCVRAGTPGPGGQTVYAEGTVTLFTDVLPRGNFGAFLPHDALLPTNQATLLDAQIQGLTARLVAAEAIATAQEMQIRTLDTQKVTGISATGVMLTPAGTQVNCQNFGTDYLATGASWNRTLDCRRFSWAPVLAP